MNIKDKRLRSYIAISVLIIMCLCIVSAMTFAVPQNRASAITNSNLANTGTYVDLGELLVESYEEKDKIFDGNTLNELYSYLTGQKNATIDDVKNAGTKDSKFFRETNLNSDKKDLVLTIDGLKWNVVYLSDTKDKSEPIVTLWLANSEQMAKFNTGSVTYDHGQWSLYNTDAAGAYPANMYGRSMIRALTLNNGGTYYEDNAGTKSHSVTPTESNPYAIYTMEKTESGKLKGSLYDFIEAPSNVQWQATLSSYDQGTYPYNSSNDSYVGDSSSANFNKATYNYYQKDGYSEWKDDKIWLPSMAETGYSNTVSGLWKTNAFQRSDSSGTNSKDYYTWMRTARYNGYFTVPILTPDGTNYDGDHVNGIEAIRPAFHLNLSEVAKVATIPTPQTKGDLKKYYSSGNTTFELDKAFDDVMKIEITATGVKQPDGTYAEIDDKDIPKGNVSAGIMSFTPSIVGEYTVTVTPLSGQYWSDGSTDAKTYTYKLKYHVTPVELNVTNPDNVVYNGDDQYLPLRYYDEAFVKVTVNNTDDVEKNSSGIYCIKAHDAKTYSTTKIELVDKNLMEWTDNDGTENRSNISVTVKPKTLSITASGAWQTSVRKADATYTLTCAGICNNDIGALDFLAYYTYQSGKETPVSDYPPTLNSNNTEITITLPSVDKIGTTDDYNYILKLDPSNALSKNYTLTFSHPFAVEKESVEISAEDIVWQYTNSNIAGGTKQTVDDASNVFEVDYNKSEYTFSVNTKYTDVNEYPKIKTELTGNIKAANANASNGKYIVTFEIKAVDNSIELKGTTTFTLEWRIRQAKYDLSKLVWTRKDSSRTEYDGRSHEVSLTIPTEYEGLKVSLTGGTWKTMDAGTHTANVLEFSAANSNYKTPKKNDTSTYDNAFVWDYIWTISKKQITLMWEDEPSMLAKDKNDVDFAYYVVSGDYKDNVLYKYYTEADYLANNRDNDIQFDQFEVPDPPTLAYYWAIAELDADTAKNHEIAGGEAKRFSLGSDKIDVVVTFKNDIYEFLYDGKAHGKSELAISVKKGTLSVNNDLVLTYYKYEDGQEIELDSEPTDSGSYKVSLALADDLDDYKLLRTQINFEIKQVTVTIADNTSTDLYYDKSEQGLDLAVTSGGLTLDDIVIEYYNKEDDGKIEGKPINAGSYYALLSLSDDLARNYVIDNTRFEMTIKKVVLTITTTIDKITYDGQTHEVDFNVKEKVSGVDFDKDKIEVTYYKSSILTENQLIDELPTNARKYVVLYSLKAEEDVNYEIDADCIQAGFEIEKIKIKAVWDTSEEIPVLSNLDEAIKEIIGYIYFDEEGNQLEDGAELEAGKSYKVKAILTGDYGDNYEFVAEDGETVLDDPAMTDEQDFTVKENNEPSIDSGEPSQPEEPTPQPPAQSFDILGFLKDNWQPLVCVVSAILIVIFMGKGMSYAGKSKKLKKTKDKKYSSYYAAGAGLFGLPQTTWTIVACTLAGVAVLAFIFMLLEKRMLSKAEEEFEEAKDEYEQAQAKKKEDEMRMMFMGMLGGNGGQQGYAYVSQPQIGLEDMRGMINDAVTAMLPNVQQYLPQQASGNDDLVEKLLEKTAKNEETIQKLIKKIAEQPTEKVVETVVAREVASANANDETIKSLIEGQKAIMQQLAEIAKNQNAEPQVVEKIVEKEVKVEVPVEVEKIVEKVIEKEVPVEVEKIVEKVVEKEVKVEVEVPVAMSEPSKPKKETAPKLTLDEAYAGLSKQQQKYFDGLRQYALTKDKCKEKKSTYFILFGQSTANPLMKLTIKKDTVVALFKMEDEYMKDIRKDATSDGTKVKVKETEVIISDAQACKVAKNMIDLREDQIERYADLLKEQRAMKNKK